MITKGQATILNSEIRSWVGLLLVGSVTLGFALILWQAAFDENPLANTIASVLYQQEAAVKL